MDASRSHRVAVLVLPTVIPLERGTVTEVFGRDPHYDLTVCAESPTSTVSGSGFTINTSAGLDAVDRAETVVVRALRTSTERCQRSASTPCRRRMPAAPAWFRSAREPSLSPPPESSTSAPTTHWRWADDLQRRYPHVNVVPNRLFVDDGDVLTSAGVTTGIDLCLHIIRRERRSRANSRAARSSLRHYDKGGRRSTSNASPRGDRRPTRRAARLDARKHGPPARPRHARQARTHVPTNAHP